MKSWLIVLVISLTIFTLTTIQLYNINKANATNKNLNQQIITTESPAEITSVLLSITNTTTTPPVATAANTSSIPTAQSVYTSQSITLPTSVKSFVWYIVD
ncbi:MAG TPA: hypothetical protein VE593_05980 [Nitrososphaeraceae archaeon]|nr:hypothetical protein [Nitrososphaeraceae archaeon]